MEPYATAASKPSFTCFVIMPFSDTAHEIAGVEKTTSGAEWTNIYQDWIKKAVESYPDANISCERSATATGNFVKGIVGNLNDSNFVIADLTGNKSNVYYELGIRHALRTGTIIITQHLGALPSDLQTYYCLEYNYSSVHYEYKKQYSVFEEQIHGLIKAIIAQSFSSDSPVSDFLGYISYVSHKAKRAEWDDAVAQLLVCKDLINRCLIHMSHLERMLGDNKAPLTKDTFEVEIVIARFYNTTWRHMDQSLMKDIRISLLHFRSIYLAVQEWIKLHNENKIKSDTPFNGLIDTCKSIANDVDELYKEVLAAEPLASTKSSPQSKVGNPKRSS